MKDGNIHSESIQTSAENPCLPEFDHEGFAHLVSIFECGINQTQPIKPSLELLKNNKYPTLPMMKDSCFPSRAGSIVLIAMSTK